jgi:membrane fusion protein (multidrug efflux system)
MRRVLGVAACAALALGLAGCGTQEASSAIQTTPTVMVTQPERGIVRRTITLPGDVRGFNEAALYAKVTGYLERIDVDKGDWVKKGQTLAVIEVPELEQKLRRAKASLEMERVTYDRLKSVWTSDQRLVAREDVDVAQGKFEQARAEVEELEAMVGYTRITAPFDGVITARYVDPGALIQADAHATSGTSGGEGETVPVVRIADIGTLRVYVYVPEEETSLIKRGIPATLTLREFPGRTFAGSVARFNTALDLSTRTMLTEVDLTNPTHELYPGMYADVTLELERHPGALTVPSTAVGGAGDKQFVYVVRDGHLSKQHVATGITDAATVEVVSGLQGEEQVVSNLSPDLVVGGKVRAVVSATAAAVPDVG